MPAPWNDALPLAALGVLAATVIMFALWRVHVVQRNASWVDVGWAGTLGVLAALYGVLGTGYAPRRLLVVIIVGIWSARLTIHLATRVMAEPEDPRYGKMRARWGGNLEAKFFTLFVGQGVLDVVLALSFLMAAVDPAYDLMAHRVADGGAPAGRLSDDADGSDAVPVRAARKSVNYRDVIKKTRKKK